jgi:hypothetical protein
VTNRRANSVCGMIPSVPAVVDVPKVTSNAPVWESRMPSSLVIHSRDSAGR